VNRNVGTATLLVAMAGCAVGPDFQRPAGPDADRYTNEAPRSESADAAAGAAQRIALGRRIEGDWWQQFRSDQLDRVVREAIDGNQTLAAAQATLSQAQALVEARTGSLFPQVSAGAAGGRQKYGSAFFGALKGPLPFTYYSIGPSVSYTLDYTGGIGRSIEQQQALAEFQRQQLAATYLSLTGNVVLRSLEIASAREQITTMENILEQDRENLRLVQTSFDAGEATRVDILSAQSQLANDATLVPPLRQALSVARHALVTLVGLPPASWSAPEFDMAQITLPSEIPVELPSELAHRRPDVLAAEAQLHAATAAVGVATANLYPQITLTATAGLQALNPGHVFNPSGTVWSFAAGLTGPLFDGGTLRAEREASIDALRADAARYQETVLQAFAQVADQLEALDHDAEQLQAQRHAVEAAQSNVRLSQLSYREGNVGVLQVLDAERQFQQAKLGFVRAQAQRYIDTAQLFVALGGSPLPSDSLRQPLGSAYQHQSALEEVTVRSIHGALVPRL
jgi:NodT family efflux transporter outer membrane factor (OMF) lipoprotein